MPHDINGIPLRVGDLVVIEAKVTDIQLGDEYCNITVVTEEPMYPGKSLTAITLNARQVGLCRRMLTE